MHTASEIVVVESVNLSRADVWPDGEPRIAALTLGELLGYERPRKLRDLVRRYEESGDLEQVYRRPTVGRYESRPGIWQERDVDEFWLTEEQALFVIAKSDTAVANEVTRRVIRAFLALRRGAVDGSAEVAKALMQVSATQATIVSKLETISVSTSTRFGAVENEVASIKSDFTTVRGDVNGLRSDVASVKEDVTIIKRAVEGKRVDIRKGVRDTHLEVVRRAWRGYCPCCNETRILTEDGRPVMVDNKPVLEWDHFIGRHLATVEVVWPICGQCHKRKTYQRDADADIKTAFDNHQRHVRKILVAQTRLPGVC